MEEPLCEQLMVNTMSYVEVSPEDAERVFNNFDPMNAPGELRINPQYMDMYVRNMLTMNDSHVEHITRTKLEKSTDLSDESIQKLSAEFSRQLKSEFEKNADKLSSCDTNARRNQIMAAVIGSVAGALAEEGINHARDITIEVIAIIASNI